jgi:hypothetical protein
VLKGLSPPDAKYSFRFNAEVLRNLPRKGHRWVVFLRCVEETDRAQQMLPLPGDKWFVPAHEVTLAALRQYFPPCRWGEASDGLRLGLHVRSDADEPTVEVVLQNVGTKDLAILQCLVPNFDDWPHLSFTVTGPDGKAWRLERTGRAYKDSPPPNNHVLKAGDRYIQTVRISRWVQPTRLTEHGNAPPGLFAEGGDFRIEATYQFLDGRDEPPWWIGKLTSGPATLAVPKPGPWGEPAGEVRARLRLPTTKYRPGEPLTFDLDLKNEGRWPTTPDANPFACEVFVDNERYTYTGPIDRKVHARELKPGAELVPFVTATVDHLWQARRVRGRPEDYSPPVPGFVPFGLTSGKHTIRVTFWIDDQKAHPTSNTVEIEVGGAKLDDETRAMAVGADRIWIAPSPTAEGKIPTPMEVLKGPPVDGRHGGLADQVRLATKDPEKRRIVFLKDESEGSPVARVKIWDESNWTRPYTPELADAIRQAFLPTEWGPERDGLQLGLRSRPADVRAGEPVAVEVTIRNVGKAAKELRQHRYNIYDYWPATRFDVMAPDGSEWLLEKPEGPMDEADVPAKFTLKPGETYTQAMWLNHWPAHRVKITLDDQTRPNLFTSPGEYTIACLWENPSGDVVKKLPPPVRSNPVKLVVKAAVKTNDWGESAGGIRARVRLAKPTFKAGELLQFEFDLKNTGDKTVEDGPIPMLCQIDLDGDLYRYTAPLGYPTSNQKIEPGKEVVPWVKVQTNQWWTHVRGDRAVPLGLTPGKHIMSVSYPLRGDITPVSPPVEFEVIADEPAAIDLPTLVARSDRIVIATIDWKDGQPRVKPERTLRGAHNRWQPDLQPLTIPAGAEPLPMRSPFGPIPGDSPTGKWIAFLKADEDGVEVPKLSPADTRGWFRPSTDTDIAAVLAAVPTVKDAGPMKNGLSLALRPTTSKIKLGEDVRLEVVLTNGSKDPIRVLQQRYNVYDYWPFLKFTVTAPSGRTMELAKPAGEFTREDYIDDVELKGGEQYAHAVRLYNWPTHRRPIMQDDGLPKTTFRKRGKYTITATYAAPIGFKNLRPGVTFDDWPFWNGNLTSNTATIEVTGPFDEVRRMVDASNPRLYVVLTAPTAGPAELAGLVAMYAGDALEEADTWHISARSIIFFIRTKSGDDRGYISGFDRQQLEAIKDAKPEKAKRLAGEHAWSLGKLPSK